jgi:hypothetical protein
MRKTTTRTVVLEVPANRNGRNVLREYAISNPRAKEMREAQRIFRMGREMSRIPSRIIAGKKYFRYGELVDITASEIAPERNPRLRA